MPDFIPGLELSQRFYEEVVRALIDRPHAAALLGEGSEVLGYDQPRSTDHAWGPRLQIFAAANETERLAQIVDRALPDEFGGWPVRFFSWQTNSVRHHVEVCALDRWLLREIGIVPREGMPAPTWLSLPQQSLLQVTQGAIFHDSTGELSRVRTQLSWYPRNVWLWLMASQWHLIGNTEPLVGRTIEAGDARGTALLATELARLLMELCFLQERRYWPYPKWFGTAFSRLQAATDVGPLLDTVLFDTDASRRQDGLARALRRLGERHNALDVTTPVEPTIGAFRVGINDAVRPYAVLNAGRFADACKQAIEDEGLRKLAPVGAIDQLTHADDVVVNFTGWPRRLEQDYRTMIEQALA